MHASGESSAVPPEYVPVGHRWHFPDCTPSQWCMCWPKGHHWQSLHLGFPAMGWYFPLGQFWHFLPAFENLPARQSPQRSLGVAKWWRACLPAGHTGSGARVVVTVSEPAALSQAARDLSLARCSEPFAWRSAAKCA